MSRYVPRFGGHGSIRFRYNRGKKSTMLGFFSFILNRQLYKLQFFFLFHLDVKILNIITLLYIYIYNLQYIYIHIQGIHS